MAHPEYVRKNFDQLAVYIDSLIENNITEIKPIISKLCRNYSYLDEYLAKRTEDLLYKTYDHLSKYLMTYKYEVAKKSEFDNIHDIILELIKVYIHSDLV